MATTEMMTTEDVQRDIAPIVQRANAITVRTADDRIEAMNFLKSVKGAHMRASEFFAPMVDSAHKAWKRATEGRASVLGPLEAAEKRIKETVRAFDTAEEETRLAEQRRLQAIEDERTRLERQRIEQEAAKQRAIEAEKLAKAEEARRLAEETEGAERKRLLAQADTAERQAAKAAAKVEVQEEAAANVQTPVVTIAAPEKRSGEATRQRWKMRLVDKSALVRAAANGNDLAASLLVYDESVGNKLASSIKGAVTIPGVATYAVSELAVKV